MKDPVDPISEILKGNPPPTGVRRILGQTRHSEKWTAKFEALPPRYRSAVGYAAKEGETLAPRSRAAHVLRTIRAVGKKAAKAGSERASLVLEFVGASAFMQREARRRMQQ